MDVRMCPRKGCNNGEVSYYREDGVWDVKPCEVCEGAGMISKEKIQEYSSRQKQVQEEWARRQKEAEERLRLERLKKESDKARAMELLHSLSNEDRKILVTYLSDCDCWEYRYDDYWY